PYTAARDAAGPRAGRVRTRDFGVCHQRSLEPRRDANAHLIAADAGGGGPGEWAARRPRSGPAAGSQPDTGLDRAGWAVPASPGRRDGREPRAAAAVASLGVLQGVHRRHAWRGRPRRPTHRVRRGRRTLLDRRSLRFLRMDRSLTDEVRRLLATGSGGLVD